MIGKQTALAHLLDLLAIEGGSRREARVKEAIAQKLRNAGCRPEWISSDDAHLRLEGDYETGNLIVQLPGTAGAPRILFSAHMDTVPLCKGAVPAVEGGRVVSKGGTGLGGDDRAGCAAIVAMAETLLKNNLPHPPTTLLFLIAEEGGLFGSRAVRLPDLGNPAMGFNLDGQDPNEIIIGAMSATRWKAEIRGRSAHAGLDPQKGISAGLAAARAIAAIADRGYFGKIEKGNRRGTANVGSIRGGEADNQVMDHILATGECRSHSPAFLEQILRVHQTEFARAAKSVVNQAGNSAKVEFSTYPDYHAFRLRQSEPCVRLAKQAVRDAGMEPRPMVMDAGLDANNLNQKGLPTVTLGTGTHHFHTIDEYVDIGQYLAACAVLLNIATSASG